MVGQDPWAGPLPPDVDDAPAGPGVPVRFRAPAGLGAPAALGAPAGGGARAGLGASAGFSPAPGAGAADPGREAGFRPEAEPRPMGPRRIFGFWREALLLIVVTLLLTVAVKAFVVEAFRIPSGSMENTLQIGDRVLVNKLVYHVRGIQRGDVVVFSGAGSWGPASPKVSRVSAAYRDAMQVLGLETGGTDYVKRVIGLPGDHVACCDAQGQITVNGVPLREESYIYPGGPPSAQGFNVTVPRNRLWVMGDHRGDSADSRYHSDDPGDGTIPESAVVGRAFLIIWPPSQVKILPIPATFASRALAAAPAPVIPVSLGFAGALPLSWAWRRVTGRLLAGRR
jgi:signal peptidase I